MKCQRTKRGRKLIQVRVLIGDTTTNANEVSVMDTNAIVTAMSTIPTSATCIDKKDCSKTTAKSAAKALRKLVENEKKDAVAAPLQAKLAIMSQKREKNSRDKTIVRNAAEAFNRSIFIELELEKEKPLTIQSKFNLEERRCLQAEESLKEERLKNKKLQNLLQYYKNHLKSVMVNRLTTEVCAGTNDALDSLVWKIVEAFGIMKGIQGEKKACKIVGDYWCWCII